MSFTAAATDKLVELALGLIVKSGELTAANEAANKRADDALAELERFRATDAAEDQIQLAEQDAALAAEVDAKRAELERHIAEGTKTPEPAAEVPAGPAEPEQGELPVVVVDEPVVVVPGEEAAEPVNKDEGEASEDASVVVDVPAPAETPEDGVDVDLGAGQPAVETPFAGEGTVEETR